MNITTILTSSSGYQNSQSQAMIKEQIQVDKNDEHKQGEIIGKEKEMKRRNNINMCELKTYGWEMVRALNKKMNEWTV